MEFTEGEMRYIKDIANNDLDLLHKDSDSNALEIQKCSSVLSKIDKELGEY